VSEIQDEGYIIVYSEVFLRYRMMETFFTVLCV